MVCSSADLILHESHIEAQFNKFGFDCRPNLKISNLVVGNWLLSYRQASHRRFDRMTSAIVQSSSSLIILAKRGFTAEITSNRSSGHFRVDIPGVEAVEALKAVESKLYGYWASADCCLLLHRTFFSEPTGRTESGNLDPCVQYTVPQTCNTRWHRMFKRLLTNTYWGKHCCGLIMNTTELWASCWR
jgi:hypothetical protein